jgi:hypothetical protein
VTLYSNFLPNPSVETATTGWVADGGTPNRGTSHKQIGSYGLSVAATTTNTQTKGVKTTVPIEPGGPYTLSGYLLSRSTAYGAGYSRGVVVKVYDLLPGELDGVKQQIGTGTFTDTGRWAVRNMSPRATADRLVITLHTGNSFYQSGFWQVSGPYVRYFRASQHGGQSGAEISANNFAGTKYEATVDWEFMEWPDRTEPTYIVDYYDRIWHPAVDGGSATVWLDALQLEKIATETAYNDGSVAGYTWSGAAHNSPTLGLSEGEAHAAASSTGTIIFGLILPLQSDAEAVSSGTIESTEISVGADAEAVSVGMLAVWNYGPASATGTALSIGEIVLAALVPLEIGGTATSSGTLASRIAVPSTSIALALSEGTLEIGLPPDMEAHGTASSVGTAMMSIAGVLEAHGLAESVGLIEIGQAVPVGAFLDFAIAGVLETDPRLSITAHSNGGILTGASGQEWERVYAEFVAPDQVDGSDVTLWRRAAYAVPGLVFTGLPAGSWQEFTRVQLELARGGGGPTPYTDGASIRTLVYPDRLNQAPVEITIINVSGASATLATGITSPIADDTAPALRVDLEPDTAYQVYTTLDLLRPFAAYTVSMYLLPSDGITEAAFYIRDADTSAVELAPPMTYSNAEPAFELGGAWRRITSTFIAPIGGGAVLTFNWTSVDPQVATESITVAGFLLEAGAETRPYFFNAEDNPQIRYRQGYLDHTGGVFHYEDSARKTYILNEALKDHVPAGIGINPPEFGLIPHYDS